MIAANGDILSVLVNTSHQGFGQLDHWQGRNIRGCLTVESIPKLEQHIAQVQSGPGTTRPIELNHTNTAALEFPIQLYHPPHRA